GAGISALRGRRARADGRRGDSRARVARDRALGTAGRHGRGARCAAPGEAGARRDVDSTIGFGAAIGVDSGIDSAFALAIAFAFIGAGVGADDGARAAVGAAGPAPRASMGSVHVAAREREPSSRRAPGIPAVSEPMREPRSDAQASAEAGDAQRRLPRAPGVAADWRADLDSLGAARPLRQAAATAAIGAMGASSGVTPARAETATSTLARTMSKASRADCRNAHSGMGLLAIPALALDAVTDTGCKW
ncbi:hypothetical protein, partial [Burkholderia pseudomallei]|uniref:hypothetical protein n=1 Tax=Burkholderia pseudomallei TaxID=28450 RepID=UPI002FC9B98C